MRKIKFRAWDKSSNTYFRECDWLSFKPGGIRFMWTDYASDETMVTDLVDGSYVLMQHTGLKDRDGKEIYEDDVILWTVGNTQGGVVKFINSGFWVKRDDGSLFMPEDRRVIGNIHQHPELTPEINRN